MIIGLSGKKQHGKSTVAKHLTDNHDFREVSWAMPLKEIIGKQLFGFTDKQVYDDIEKEKIDPFWGWSPRYILQIVGTNCFRNNICDDFWIRLGVKRIKEIQEYDPTMNIVVSDCRFLNEVKAVEDMGGSIIRVLKLNKEDLEDSDFHASETELDNYTFKWQIWANAGDTGKLKKDIDTFVKTRR